MTIPGLIYFAMGVIIARILLDSTQTQGYRLMDWLNLVFNVSRITILWPLVLFMEKFEDWLKREPEVEIQFLMEKKVDGEFENAVPVLIPATGTRNN
jgi:hypothetical protein